MTKKIYNFSVPVRGEELPKCYTISDYDGE